MLVSTSINKIKIKINIIDLIKTKINKINIYIKKINITYLQIL